MFNRPFYERLSAEFSKADKFFDHKKFLTEVTKDLEPLSLNQRMRNTSVVLQKHLPSDYKKAFR